MLQARNKLNKFIIRNDQILVKRKSKNIYIYIQENSIPSIQEESNGLKNRNGIVGPEINKTLILGSGWWSAAINEKNPDGERRKSDTGSIVIYVNHWHSDEPECLF